jgi:hypothetical protein
MLSAQPGSHLLQAEFDQYLHSTPQRVAAQCLVKLTAWLAGNWWHEQQLEKLPRRQARQRGLQIWISKTLSFNPKLLRDNLGFFTGGLG